MRAHTRIALVGLAAAFMLAAAVGVSDARRFNTSSRPIRIDWGEGLSLNSGPENPQEIMVTCHLTLEGSFHSATISKVSGSLIGHITRIVMDACPGGGFTTSISHTEALPWKIVYTSFTGTLPNIANVRTMIEGIGFLFRGLNQFGLPLRCLYTSSATTGEFGVFFELTAGTVTKVRADERRAFENTLTLEGSTICPSHITPSMEGRLTVLNSTTAVTIRLVQ